MITCFYAEDKKKNKKKLAPPPSNISSTTKDYENFFKKHENICSFKTNRLLPVMNVCEASENENGYKDLAEYKASIIELASCNLHIFHHDRAWLDSEIMEDELEEGFTDITGTMLCPCKKNDEAHVKYMFDNKGELYVCNGYLNQVLTLIPFHPRHFLVVLNHVTMFFEIRYQLNLTKSFITSRPLKRMERCLFGKSRKSRSSNVKSKR